MAKASGNSHSPPLKPPRRASTLRAPCKGAFFCRVQDPAGKLSLQPEALGAAQEVTNGLKHFEKRPLMEVSGPRGPQRAVNTEQAPKRPSWEPTRHNNGEGRRCG